MAPASRLMGANNKTTDKTTDKTTMNRNNDFDINEIRKFYNEEFIRRMKLLTLSTASNAKARRRLEYQAMSLDAALLNNQLQQEQNDNNKDTLPATNRASQLRIKQKSDLSSRRRTSSKNSSPFVDLNRYNRTSIRLGECCSLSGILCQADC